MAWCLPDEPDPIAERALDRLAGEEGVVPTLFWHEVRNVLLTAERRERIAPVHADEALSWLRALPIRADQGAEVGWKKWSPTFHRIG